MTYLTTMQALAKNAGTAVPTTVGGTDADSVKFAEFINEAGDEIARRVDWSALRKSATITGDGVSGAKTIATDFARLARGMNVVTSTLEPVRGSLTQDEWLGLAPTEGTPRYYYLVNAQIGLWPYLASADTVSVQYQAKNWVSASGGDTDAMTQDADTALFDEDLLLAFALVRWRRHVGKDFSDYLAEAEAMLADKAAFDGGVRSP